MFSQYPRKKSEKTITRYAKIFQITVREDAHEVGIVLGIPQNEEKESLLVRGEIKSFINENEKLRFLTNAQKKGFQNFSSHQGKLDTEEMVLAELARRQKKYSDSQNITLDTKKRNIRVKNFV